MGNFIVRLQDYRQAGRKPPSLFFTRAELSRLLGLYATRVIKGEWRDYAISSSPESASFMVFKSSREYPQFVISKLGKADGRKTARAGCYVVTSRERKLSQGHSLDDVLAVFNRPLGLVSG
ncbi:MAG: DUF2794 domain-containing protein [Rhodospirillaceae bacterium]|nr:DUF2794 domain-containing protein [Rhodospirillaceae bacterium]